jgi:hypothetical protein
MPMKPPITITTSRTDILVRFPGKVGRAIVSSSRYGCRGNPD